jgi:ParB/RepB/Spo0J family partition protein
MPSSFASPGAATPDTLGNSVQADKDAIIIPLASIEISADAPRKDFDLEQMQELTQDIKAKGVLEPILVKKGTTLIGKPPKFLLISGHRRLRAAISLNLDTIPARFVRCHTDEDKLAIQLSENIQRKDLHPIEIALLLRSFLELGYKEKEIAEKISKSPSWVSKYKKISKMPIQIIEDSFSFKASLSDLLILESHFPKHSDLILAWDIYKKEGLKSALKGLSANEEQEGDKLSQSETSPIAKWDSISGITREFLIVTKNQNVLNCRMQVSESQTNDVRVILPKQYSVEEIEEIFEKIIQSINTQ